ncbi:sugar transferase [Ureibacillus chungkukjangi]|uniref:Lipopolysaccharide/colanic/teichoic acid biosynthesis glycosyltransferase n=1 Tax=Ureibacillus chungkukjangi TaxID=1202712 RepID=A0A318TN87_9BACL|nr:sugar transferase [Ureibacillus chungkukjangi]PYF06064.1 lipopolysaccharide/colanic/teichoic acid biosynthesis glycosyltransferase [Ureibacillus chungkukjangi]
MDISTIHETDSKKNHNNKSVEPIVIKNNLLYFITKRMMDICLSIIGLIVLSPLLLFVSILLKFEDKNGSVIFKQLRTGKDGCEFYMYKFRSMVSNAEAIKGELLGENEATGPVFKMKDDPRVTKVGRLIRKTSIDELPQLINVLRGEMSLVGPRPPLPDEVAEYNAYEMQRLRVKPGLTCYWQVGGRSSLDFEQWIELDLKYIRERNTLVDVLLIFKTVFVLFGSKNAY